MKQRTAEQTILEYDGMKTYPGIVCFSTTRHGGYSQGAYASFNCNTWCGDREEHVARNRALLYELLPQRPDALVIPHQVHGTVIRCIDSRYIAATAEHRHELLEGVDALVTDVPGYCLCISTADCIPVLIHDPVHRVVAAIHAGWRGTMASIVRQTVETLAARYGSAGNDLAACIGPGISQAAFEVGDEVYDAFATAGFDMERIACRKTKWHIDLWEANRQQLLACGIRPEHIEVAGICTYTDHENFFSARRLGIRSGRILSGIMLKK